MEKISRRLLRHAATLVCLLIVLTSLVRSSTAADRSLEYAVKATDLLKFTKFIEWPSPAPGTINPTFNICVLGTNPFGTTLDQVVAGEAVNGRKVIVERIERVPVAGSCQIVFFSDQEQAARSLAEIRPGVLTVGEGAEFVRHGGMIGFLIEDRRVTFDINRRAADAAGIRLSSSLLNVAKSVIK